MPRGSAELTNARREEIINACKELYQTMSFKEITMIPFCTSSSSGIGRSGKNLEENAGSGNWLDGERFSANPQESEIQMWIYSLQKDDSSL